MLMKAAKTCASLAGLVVSFMIVVMWFLDVMHAHIHTYLVIQFSISMHNHWH